MQDKTHIKITVRDLEIELVLLQPSLEHVYTHDRYSLSSPGRLTYSQ